MQLDRDNRIIKRKLSKKKTIGYFTEKHLIKRGKKDAENGTVRKAQNGNYCSPFFQQEISLCMAQINREKELLEKRLLLLQSETTTREMHIAKKKVQIDSKISCLNAETVNAFSFEVGLNNFLKSLQETELDNRKSTIQNRINNITSSIEMLKIENQKSLIYAEKEIQITKFRCLQIYEYLSARLSAYWTGVLISIQDNIDIPPLFAVESLLSVVKEEIETLSLYGGINNV